MLGKTILCTTALRVLATSTPVVAQSTSTPATSAPGAPAPTTPATTPSTRTAPTATTPPQQPDAKAKADAEKAEAERKAAADKAGTKQHRSYEGGFVTPVLADDMVNELRLPIRPENLLSIPENDNAGTLIKFSWLQKECRWTTGKVNEDAKVLFKRPVKDEPDQVALFVTLPPRPCYWPMIQFVAIEIKGKVAGEEENQILFNGRALISGSWIPIAATLVVLALIYPGCAFVAWIIAWRRYDKTPSAERIASERPYSWRHSIRFRLPPISTGGAAWPSCRFSASVSWCLGCCFTTSFAMDCCRVFPRMFCI